MRQAATAEVRLRGEVAVVMEEVSELIANKTFWRIDLKTTRLRLDAPRPRSLEFRAGAACKRARGTVYALCALRIC